MGVNSVLTHPRSSTSRVACHYLFTLNLIFISFMIFYILKTSSLLGLSPLFQNLVSGVLITSILSLLRLILYFTLSSLPVSHQVCSPSSHPPLCLGGLLTTSAPPGTGCGEQGCRQRRLRWGRGGAVGGTSTVGMGWVGRERG